MPIYPINVCSFYLKTIVLSGRVDFYDLQSPWGHVYIFILFRLRKKTIDEASGQPQWLKVTKTWVKSTIFFWTKSRPTNFSKWILEICRFASAKREFGVMAFWFSIKTLSFYHRKTSRTISRVGKNMRWPTECAGSAEPLKEATKDPGIFGNRHA